MEFDVERFLRLRERIYVAARDLGYRVVEIDARQMDGYPARIVVELEQNVFSIERKPIKLEIDHEVFLEP